MLILLVTVTAATTTPSEGIWSLDSNGNSKWDVSDKAMSWGLSGDIQVVGDWNGDGKDDRGYSARAIVYGVLIQMGIMLGMFLTRL